MGMTITEALAEIKTIGKRLEKKRGSIGLYTGRDARVKDPLEREGGSVEFIKRERQAITDLEARVVLIRTSIQKSNLGTRAVIQGVDKSVSEWLTWRREIAPGTVAFINNMVQGINQMRAKIQKDGKAMLPAKDEGSATPGDVVVHLDEKGLHEESEKMEQILGELDGRLSLLNATTIIDV